MPTGMARLQHAEALEQLRRLLHAADGWSTASVVARHGLRDRRGCRELLGQDHRIDQGAVGTLSQVRSHGVGGVTEQDEPAGEPARTIDLTHRIHQQPVERRNLLQQLRRDRKNPTPLLPKRLKITSRHRVSRRSDVGRCPEVDVASAQRGMAEGSQRGPVLLEPRVRLTADDRAHVAASCGHPALESAGAANGRADPIGTDDEISLHGPRAGIGPPSEAAASVTIPSGSALSASQPKRVSTEATSRTASIRIRCRSVRRTAIA